MPLLDTLCKWTTQKGRACLALQRAKFFAIGRIGPSARVPSAERALLRLLCAPQAASILLEVLQQAPLPGQLYALVGLHECGYQDMERLLKAWRGRSDEVAVQTGCLVSSQKVSQVVESIEDGRYSQLLEAHGKS